MTTIEVKSDLIRAKGLLDEKIYLSDLPEFSDNNLKLLHNTVFDKSVTGIGGTTLALRGKESIIILMPFIEVVNNKSNVIREQDGFMVKGGVTINSIASYIKRTKVRKIVSTFDGLIKIKEAYERANINMYDDFLMVDEWQVLFQQYGFRTDAIRIVLDESVHFTKKCFMTATPIKKDYWFDELQGLDELKLIYDIEPIELKRHSSNNILDETIAVVRRFEHTNNNLHFFINSVDTIKAVTSYLDVDQSDVRIICSQQEKNEAKLARYKIETTNDPVKRLNFYTSTCFEGCDIFDKKGKIFVLCDGYKAHTLTDIATTLPQIAGRIRDIEDSTVNLIYTSSRYIGQTQESFDASIDENIRLGEKVVEGVGNKEALSMMDYRKLNSRYLMVVGDKLVFEKTFLNVDKANFEISRDFRCKANMNAKLSLKFNTTESERGWAKEIERVKTEKISKMSFKDQCIAYSELKNKDGDHSNTFDIDVIDAVNKIGIDEIHKLDYHKNDVRKSLIGISNDTVNVKVLKMLRLNKLQFYSSSSLKDKFTDAYLRVGSRETAKATDVEKYYQVQETIQRVEGIPTRGFVILSEKVVIK